MKAITSYQSDNGKIFATAGEAVHEDARCTLIERLDSTDGLYGNMSSGKVSSDEIVEFIDENFDAISEYIRMTENTFTGRN